MAPACSGCARFFAAPADCNGECPQRGIGSSPLAGRKKPRIEENTIQYNTRGRGRVVATYTYVSVTDGLRIEAKNGNGADTL